MAQPKPLRRTRLPLSRWKEEAPSALGQTTGQHKGEAICQTGVWLSNASQLSPSNTTSAPRTATVKRCYPMSRKCAVFPLCRIAKKSRSSPSFGFFPSAAAYRMPMLTGLNSLLRAFADKSRFRNSSHTLASILPLQYRTIAHLT